MNHLAAAALLLISVSCTATKPPARQDTTGNARARSADATHLVPGTLFHFGEGPEIGVPSTARIGEAIPLTVTTYGGGCTGEDTTVIAVDSLIADIRPYQRVPTGPETCIAILRVNRRSLLVTFTTRGRATIRVHGRAEPGDSAVTVTRTVLVH